MNIISAYKISKSYSDKVLFQDISFGLEAGNKVALIGLNGSGKSTLLKILMALEEADSGNISINKSIQIAYLAQEIHFNNDHTVLDHILQDGSSISRLIMDYENCLKEIELDYDEKVQNKLSDLTERMDKENAWTYEATIHSTLKNLGITDTNQKMSELSGGQKKRVSLAQTLLKNADFLILDEPTNHLDMDSICYLEETLKKSQKTLLIVTHDRYFLDAVCNTVIELYKKDTIKYSCNYSAYLEKKAEQENIEKRSLSRLDNILRNEIKWLKRGAKARSTKQKARINRIGDLKETRVVDEKNMNNFSTEQSRMGKKIVELEGIEKLYNGVPIIKDFSYFFKKGDRIGIVGPNGSGKTTLLNLITGQISPDSGTFTRGKNTIFGIFDQFQKTLNENQTVLEYLKEYADSIKIEDGKTVSVQKFLEMFLFPNSMFNTVIQKLSGGEKKRLFLIRMLLGSPNFLIFDEPTNDLDIQTLSLLEDFIEQFTGCLVVVSHDRFFLDRTVDTLFVLDSTSEVKAYVGSCSEYVSFIKENPPQIANRSKKNIKIETPKKNETPHNTAKSRASLSKKEKIELQELEKEIYELENEIKYLQEFFLSGSIDTELIQKHSRRLKEIEPLLLVKNKLWEKFAEKSK